MFTRFSILAVSDLLVLILLGSLSWGTQSMAMAAPEPANSSPKETASTAKNDLSETSPEAEPVPRHFDLGIFQIAQFRPTRNETIEMQFALHLVLPDEVDETVEKGLKSWKHRLREQVITAVRLTESRDFSEPELLLLRRVIRLRINRILPTFKIAGLYMTHYVFGKK